MGSPQQVIDRTLGFREYVGDYQRQLFLIDHAGLPLKTVLEQLDLLGEEVVPVLRKEFAALRPAHVPEAPTHASLVAAAGGAKDSTVHAVDDVTAGTGGGADDRRILAVVSAGLSQPSSTRLLADQLAAATRDELVRRGVRGRAHGRRAARPTPTTSSNNLLTGFPPAALRDALDAVTGADGLIAVTPIFNASYSGLFKSFFDVLDAESLADKPVLIGATGGTARHSLALEHAVRPMFAYLRAVVVPTSVFAAPEDWADGTADGALRGRIERAAGELADQIERRPPASGPADPFALTTDFLQMLGGVAGRTPVS